MHCRVPTGVESATDSPELCLVALTILKRAGGLRLQKPSHGKKGRSLAARLVGNDAFSLRSPSVSAPRRSFLCSLGLLTCFALVRPSHLYLGVARQKKGRKVRLRFGPQGEELVCKIEGHSKTLKGGEKETAERERL